MTAIRPLIPGLTRLEPLRPAKALGFGATHNPQPLQTHEQAMVDNPALGLELIGLLTGHVSPMDSPYFMYTLPGAFNVGTGTVPLLEQALQSPKATPDLKRLYITALRRRQADDSPAPGSFMQLAQRIEDTLG